MTSAAGEQLLDVRGLTVRFPTADGVVQAVSDVSFTLFLSEPESYDGGELVIESAAGEDAVKLDAGSLVA